jgi:hypothetical protein
MAANKDLYEVIPECEFENNLTKIKELHEQFRRDGYAYFHCSEECLEAIQKVLTISETFFNLPVEQKKSFHSLDVVEKRRKQRLTPKGDIFYDQNDFGEGFDTPDTSSLSDFFGDFLARFTDIFGCSSSSSSSSTVIVMPQPATFPSSLTSSSNTNNNNITLSNYGPQAECSVAAVPMPVPVPVPIHRNSNSSNNKPAVNRASGKGYINSETHTGTNAREYYDVSENDVFQHKQFQEISQQTFQLFQSLCKKIVKQLLFPLEIGNEGYLDELMTGPSHTKLRLIKYIYSGQC